MSFRTRERNLASITLRWSLGVVILVESVLFLFSSVSRHEFAGTHLPDSLRLILGVGEILGSILLLVPGAVALGARLLMFVFALAILIHLLHRMLNVGSLVIYFAGAWVIASGATQA